MAKWIVALAMFANGVIIAGEPQRISVRSGLVELRLRDVPNGADVSWEARDPVATDFRVYEGGSVLVTYLESGSAVFGSDVIDWENRKRDRTTWIVVVEAGPNPKPDPVKPNPVKPDPPGLAGEVARLAKANRQPEIASRYAGAFRTAIAEINAGAIKMPQDARDRITALCTGISPGNEPWKAVGAFIASRLREAKTLPEIVGIFGEAMNGLEAAGETQ